MECFLYMFISSKLLLDGLLGEAIKHNTRFTSTYCLGSTRIKHRSMSYSAVVIRPNYKVYEQLQSTVIYMYSPEINPDDTPL